MNDRDPGDEDDWRGPRMRYGGTLCFWPRRWFEETPARAMPNHDPGDEDPWQPLSELSQRRLLKHGGIL